MSQEMYCYVGDLLGFSNIISNLDPSDQSERVGQWTMLIENNARKHGITDYQMISDTVFAGAENSPEGLENIINFAKGMLEEGIIEKLSVRGGISFGEVTWAPKVSFGKAIVNAYNLANNQNWIGTACEPILSSHIDSKREELWDLDRIIMYDVPMKTGIVRCIPAISWNLPPTAKSHCTLADRLFVQTLGKGLSKKNGENVKWSNKTKIQNTLIFLIYLKILKNSQARMIANGNNVLKRFPHFLQKVANDPLKIIDLVLTEQNTITIPDHFMP